MFVLQARRARARKACLSAPRTFCYGKAQLERLLEDPETGDVARRRFKDLRDELDVATLTGDLGVDAEGSEGAGEADKRKATELSLYLSDLRKEAEGKKRRKTGEEHDDGLAALLYDVVRLRALDDPQDEVRKISVAPRFACSQHCSPRLPMQAKLQKLNSVVSSAPEAGVARAKSEPMATITFLECMFDPKKRAKR